MTSLRGPGTCRVSVNLEVSFVMQGAPDWYPDPAGGPELRWWDGQRWTGVTRSAQPDPPAPAQVAFQPAASAGSATFGPHPSAYPAPPFAQGAVPPPPHAPGSNISGLPTIGALVQRSRYTLITVAIVVAYVLLAFFVHVVFLGILPFVFAARAMRAREPLAPLAIVVSVAALVFAIYSFAHPR